MADIKTRFMEVYNYLLGKGLVSGYKDFANKISVSTSMITEISKGRSNVGTTAIQNTVSIFPINADWLLTGKGTMLKLEESNLESTPSPPDPGIVMRLMDKLDERDRKIEELTEKLHSAEKEIISLKSGARIEALEKENQNENTNKIKSQYEEFPPLLVDTFTPISSYDYIEPSPLPAKQKSSKKSSALKT